MPRTDEPNDFLAALDAAHTGLVQVFGPQGWPTDRADISTHGALRLAERAVAFALLGLRPATPAPITTPPQPARLAGVPIPQTPATHGAKMAAAGDRDD